MKNVIFHQIRYVYGILFKIYIHNYECKIYSRLILTRISEKSCEHLSAYILMLRAFK